MITVLLVVHLLLAIALIGVVLLQRSEGGGLGIGGGTGGMGGFMSGRGTANLLSRTTAVLAACFMLTSLALTLLASGTSERPSIVDELPATGPLAPAPQEPPASEQQQPTQPAQPAVPVQ